jgi:hypothetical protein
MPAKVAQFGVRRKPPGINPALILHLFLKLFARKGVLD